MPNPKRICVDESKCDCLGNCSKDNAPWDGVLETELNRGGLEGGGLIPCMGEP